MMLRQEFRGNIDWVVRFLTIVMILASLWIHLFMDVH